MAVIKKIFKFRLTDGKIVTVAGFGTDEKEAEQNAIDNAITIYENVEAIIYV